MPFVYKITSPVGKVYVGSTINTLKERWKHYKTLNCKSQLKLYSSLKKYGVDKHIFSVICETSFENMLSTEHIIGMQYEVLGKNGLNLALPPLFGTGRIITDESRKRMSEAQKGEKSFRYGKKSSEESKRKLSESRKGIKFTDEHKAKLSEAKKGKKLKYEHRLKISQSGKNKLFSDSHRENLSKALAGGKNIRAKKVKDTETGRVWDCLKDAAKELNINKSTLGTWVRNKNKFKTSLIYI